VNARTKGKAMSESRSLQIGKIAWQDLTVLDAAAVRDFYAAVVGWNPKPVNMGDYDDYNMLAPGTGDCVAGICHARGVNAKIPPQWLIYIAVEDAERSAKVCVERGGKIIDGPRKMGKQAFVVIQDPAGACAALISDQRHAYLWRSYASNDEVRQRHHRPTQRNIAREFCVISV
jgi:hypothetical protein